MRDYELVFIVHPDLEDNALKDVLEKVNGWITDSCGQVQKVDLWGRRKLAYPIRKQSEGQYVQIDAQINPAFGSELERNLRFLEPVLRFLITVK